MGRIMSTATEPRTIRVGHSPDSDDAFMFYALTHDKLDAEDRAWDEGGS